MASNKKQEERNRLVFVYGTLQSGGRLNNALTRCKGEFIGEANILSKDFVMRNLQKYPCIHPVENGSGSYIRGEVWSIPTKNIAVLDQVEGCPGFFKRKEITVWIENSNSDEQLAYTAIVYYMEYSGDNLTWLPSCDIVESGKWDAISNAPFIEDDRVVTAVDCEDCPECGYWIVDMSCNNCGWHSGDVVSREYYDDNVTTDPWDDAYANDVAEDVPFEVKDEKSDALKDNDFTADSGIYITNTWGEQFGPYDSIAEACCKISAVAAECEGGNSDSYIIGFRVYPNDMDISKFTEMEESTTLV